MAKKANGEGSFKFREDKQLWVAAFTLPSGKKLTKSGKIKEPVEDWYNEQRLLIGRGQHVEPSSMIFGDWLTTFIETYKKPETRQRTYERHLSLADHAEPIEHLPLQKITPVHLQQLYNFLIDEGLSGQTVRHVHNLIKSSLDQAVLNKYLHSNPAAAVKSPRVTREEVKIYTATEISLLLETAKSNRLYAAILLAVTTGMRLGEILGIRWQDINLSEAYLNVRQSLQATNIGIIFEPPKTEKGKRKIPLPPQTIAALKEYKKAWSESRLKYPGKDDLVFVSTKHTSMSPQNFTKRVWNKTQIMAEFAMNKRVPKPMSEHKKLENILEECRSQKDWQEFPAKNFHALRHTYATTLLANGVPIVDVSRVLGHARVSTTLDIYGHAIPENLNLIADKIAGAFL